MDELHHPEYWELKYGFYVMDPDGWRSNGVPWDRAITQTEFQQLVADSTTHKGERK